MTAKSAKLTLDDFFEEDFRLIAIYTNEEDYRMAFLLNYYFQLHFRRNVPIKISKKNHEFQIFEYKDKSHFRDWYLLHNYFLKEEKLINSYDLFESAEIISEKPVFYINELRNAKFLLKIVGDESDFFYEKFTKNLKEIPQIYTAELVDLNCIKKQNLLNF